MEFQTYLDFVRRESAALAAAAASVSLETGVPSCPGWTMGQLVAHIGQAQEWAQRLIEARAQEPQPFEACAPGLEGEPLIQWFRERTAALVATFEATDPATPLWNWTNNRSAGFWARREAHEVAIHRWDAQNAAGLPHPIDPRLAVDGADELLEILSFIAPQSFVGAGESIHLHATDVPGELLIRLGPKGLEVTREHGRADAVGRGTASDIALFLWGRLPLSALEVTGDEALLTRFQLLTAR